MSLPSAIPPPDDEEKAYTNATQPYPAEYDRDHSSDDLEAANELAPYLSRRKSSDLASLDDQIALSKALSHHSTHDEKVPSMGDGRPYPPNISNSKDYQVTFDGPDDPEHPFNWTTRHKLRVAMPLALCSLATASGSALFSAATDVVAEIYHVKPVVASLGVSLYVVGFASGPVVWSPISELYGRKMPILLSMFTIVCFFFATATAKDLQTILITRFFCGFVGSAPLTVVAAAFADMYDNTTRGYALDIFAMTVFCGPLLAPIIGGFIVESYLGWRWTCYIMGIFSSAALVSVTFLMEETYHPLILAKKASKIRELTDNWAVYAAHEKVTLDFGEIATKTITRPLKMLVTEPIILLLSLYNGFCYSILYLCLSSYPYAFGVKYHWTLSHAMLPYVGIVVGMFLAGFAMMFYYEPRYIKKSKEAGGKPVPDERLETMKPAGIAFAIGLLWFFWTANYPNKVHWAVPAVSGIFTGYGLMGLFVPSMNYIVDCYLFFAASALAALTFLRSIMGASSPLFANYMFEGMGFNWAGLLLGLIAVAMAPVPFLFSWYGDNLRQRSPFAFKG